MIGSALGVQLIEYWSLIDTLIHTVLEVAQHHNTSTLVIHLDTLISDTIRANQFTYLRCYAGLHYNIITSKLNSTLVDVLAFRSLNTFQWFDQTQRTTRLYTSAIL